MRLAQLVASLVVIVIGAALGGCRAGGSPGEDRSARSPRVEGPTTRISTEESAAIEAERVRLAADDAARRAEEEESRARAAEVAAAAEREANSRRIAAETNARFPIQFDKFERYEPGGRRRSFWTGVKGQISKGGRVDLIHVVETKEVTSGFTGYALMQFKDREGNIIWNRDFAARGVNGTGVPFGAPSRRSDPYTFTLDPSVVFHVHSVAVIPLGAPQDTGALLTENINKLKKFAEDNKAAVELIVQLIAAGG